MTKARDPRWKEEWFMDSFDDVKTLGIKGEKMNAWLDELNAANPKRDATPKYILEFNREAARLDLYDIAMSFMCGHERGAGAFTTKQARDGLHAIVKKPSAAQALKLNDRAEAALLDALFERCSPEDINGHSSIVEAFQARDIDEIVLRDAAELALNRLNILPKTKDGRPAKRLGLPRQHTLEWAVGELCELWERSTGMPVKAWNSEGHEYSKASTSKAGRWVTSIITALSNDDTVTDVRREVQAYVRQRRKTKRA